MFSKLFENGLSKKYLLFGIILALSLWFFWKNPDIAAMLFISILFACALSPLVNQLSKKMNRTLATTIVLTSLIIISTLILFVIIDLGAVQIKEFAENFPGYVDNLDDAIAKIPFLKKFNIEPLKVNDMVTTLAASSSNIIVYLTEFLANVSSTFIYVFTAVIFLFFFLVDEKLVKDNMVKLLPSEIREKTKSLFGDIGEKLGGYVVAQIIVSGSVWITMTIGLLLFRIKGAFVLGLIAGILSLIPVVGSAISYVICLLATYTLGIKTMIIITILFTISHFIENHAVRPYVYSKFLSMHPIIVFLALFVGAKYAGVLGVIFAPPLIMVLCILLEELYSKRMD